MSGPPTQTHNTLAPETTQLLFAIVRPRVCHWPASVRVCYCASDISTTAWRWLLFCEHAGDSIASGQRAQSSRPSDS